MATLKSYADREEYAKSVTSRACPSHSGGCRSNYFRGNQCFGFAKYMCYVIYGSYPEYAQPTTFTGAGGQRTDGWYYYKRGYSAMPALQTGDMIRWYCANRNIHAAIIYSQDNGVLTLFDCNNLSSAVGRCEIGLHTMKLSEFQSYYNSSQAYVCRYNGKGPDITLTLHPGTGAAAIVLPAPGKEAQQHFTIPNSTFSRQGCQLLGWSETAGSDAVAYTGGEVTPLLRKSKDLYAVWGVTDPQTGAFSATCPAAPGMWTL